jgi:hypothetical protein
MSFSDIAFAQKGIVTVGFQFKPIFNNDFFRAGSQSAILGNASVTIKPSSGYCAGMVIRKGLTDRLSLESGINYVRRNYTVQLTDTNYYTQQKFKFIGYEIPLSLLVYIRLGEKIFMDASIGNSFDFYPSDVFTESDDFVSAGFRKAWLKPALIANLGVEFRTEKSGYFYLGTSYHRPYTAIFQSRTNFYGKVYPTFVSDISGNYLTIDIRYFFNEEPLNKQRKSRNND